MPLEVVARLGEETMEASFHLNSCLNWAFSVCKLLLPFIFNLCLDEPHEYKVCKIICHTNIIQ